MDDLRLHGLVGSGKKPKGTAVASQVLAGETFSNDVGIELVGTMVDRSGDTVAVSSSVSGTTLKLKASEGYRDGLNDFVTITDADFIASNIKSGKNLFGINGTLIDGTGMKKMASGSVTSSSSAVSFKDPSNNNANSGSVTVSGLTFTPSLIEITRPPEIDGDTTFYTATRALAEPTLYPSVKIVGQVRNGFNEIYYRLASPAFVNATGFCLPVGALNATYNWRAYE